MADYLANEHRTSGTMVLPPALKIAVQIPLPEDLVVLVNQSFMHVWFLWSAWDLGAPIFCAEDCSASRE
jgi:hypothetical protein